MTRVDSEEHADVVIVGGGPIGLMLGMDLARRGIRVTLLEARSLDEPPEPKTNHIASRTMEVFRSLGFADEVRRAGLPSSYPQDVAYRTTLDGFELGRVVIPAPDERGDPRVVGPDVWWPTPEPSHRVNQMYTDPILVKHARATAGLTIHERTEVESVVDAGYAVTVRGTDRDGKLASIDARYAIGCDGGHSRVRAMIGAELEGEAYVQRYHAVYFDSPDLLSRIDSRHAWQTHFVHERQYGSLIAIDGLRLWLGNIPLPRSVDENEKPDIDSAATLRTMLGVGDDLSLTIRAETTWIGRRLVSNKFREGRIFLCGDSSHIWIPFGGYGMNAGVADAMNLSWLLAANIRGWAGDPVLDAYEAERREVTLQVSHFAMNAATALLGRRSALAPYLEEDSARGLQARRQLGKELVALGSLQYCAGGLNFGYFYDKSPIICYDDEPQPDYTIDSFAQSTVPGCRTPHVWLDGDRSLYDLLGPEFTLIRSDAAVPVDGLVRAAQAASVPLTVLDIETSDPVYSAKLVLSRPDRHVAWRGAVVPADPAAVIAVVTGAGPEHARS